MNTDWLKKLMDGIEHNRYVVIAAVIAAVGVGGLIGMAGCQSETAGIIPDTTVTRAGLERQAIEVQADMAAERAELDAKVDAFNARVAKVNSELAAANADLDRKDEMRAKTLEAITTLTVNAASGTVNPTGVVVAGLGIFGTLMGLGAAADNRRKDTIITEIKAENKTPVA